MLKTGQTTSYFSGDDGDLQLGFPRVYELRTTGQHAGFTPLLINGVTEDLQRDVAVDNHTGLMWTRDRADSSGPSLNGTLLWTDGVNNETIFEYVIQANINNHAGYNDWRVPNITELLSLHIAEGVSPFMDTTAFRSIAVFPGIWSSTTDPLNSANAFIVQFSSMTYNAKPKNTVASAYLVRSI